MLWSPPTMEHVPPDPPFPPAPPHRLGSFITTIPISTVPPTPHHSAGAPPSRDPQSDNIELIRSLEALQMTAARAIPSSSREPDPFNLLLMVADPIGNAAPISEDVARSDLTNL